MAFHDRFDRMSSRFQGWALWSTPLMLWTAHAAPLLWVTIGLTGPFIRDIPWMWLAVGIWLLMFVALLGAMATELTHEVQMCTRCAANMPLNATAAARLVRALLWMHHYKEFALLAPMAVLSLWKYSGGMPSWLHDPAGVLLFLGFGVFAQALLVHRAHRIWCPYCNGGWEGDPDAPVEPVLDPTPPGKRRP